MRIRLYDVTRITRTGLVPHSAIDAEDGAITAVYDTLPAEDGAQINPLNPASYTAIDSLTFLFEGGVSLQNMNISGSGVKLNAKNSSFDYLAMQFRLHPRIAMSIGLLPFSNVGYSVSDSKVDNGVSQTRSFTGDGGLHQLYGGIGVKVLKNLSLGVNASYFWGDITRTRTIIYPATSESYSYIQQMGVSISDYKLDFGTQYTLDFNKKHSMTIGAVFSPKHKLNNDYTVTTQVSTTNSNNLDATLELPNTFGVGFTYNYDKRLTVGADYSLQQWSKTKFGVNTSDDAVREDFNETLPLSPAVNHQLITGSSVSYTESAFDYIIIKAFRVAFL